MSSPAFRDVFEEVVSDTGITAESVRLAFGSILAGSWTPSQVAGFVVALRMRGESAAVIAAAAEALREAMVRVDHGFSRVLDTCGTGGDGRGTLNLSTGAAVIAAATGVAVAKHGNRAVSSRSGSADVLEALGIPIDLSPRAAAAVLAETNITFLMAPAHHPAMRHAAKARTELGIRTIFNCLGPLANPALATHQLLGTYEDGLRRIMAETLQRLGIRRAWVVRSRDGLDELSPFGPTDVVELSEGRISERTVTPADFGLDVSAPGAIDGGDAAHNAAAFEAVLRGEPHRARDAFVLNAAAALVVAEGLSPLDAARRAEEMIDTGAALDKLDSWRRAAVAKGNAV